MLLRSWQDALALKTYPLGPEDPNPPFQREEGSWSIYPYPMQDDLLEGPPVDRDWTALHLENDYLHCIVLPELGGHMYSLYDKVCGREVFYRNNVVKYGLVSVRGAWISGGIEFNFPMGHTYTTVSPVSYELGHDEDEAWLVIGNTCRLSRMTWSVKLSLEPEARRLLETITLENPRPEKQRYWFWNNTAVPAGDDLRLVYPARRALVAGGPVTYPVTADGRDISRYSNHDHADDIFTQEVTDDFFGCHYVDSDFGMVNVASHEDVQGRKYFTWGTADDGMIWVDLLTDNDGQYVEIQSGRFETQSIWEWLPPFGSITWNECWMPENGMGGWVAATEDAVVNFEIADGKLRMGALAAVELSNARLALFAGDRMPWQARLSLKPGKSFATVIDMPHGCDESTPFELVLVDPETEELIVSYTHRPPRTPEVLTGPPAPTPEDQASAQELAVRGNAQLKALAHGAARRLFDKALTLDPGFCAARTGLGLLDLRAGLNESAREHLEIAARRDPDDAEAGYYLGLAQWRCGDLPQARQTLIELASRRPDFPRASLVLSWLESRITQDPSLADPDALVEAWQDGLFGLCDATGREAVDTPEEAVERFTQWARGDAQLWIEEALDLGPGAGVAVLRTGLEQSPEIAAEPMVHYLLAYWLRLAEETSAANTELALARGCAPDFCFPSRLEELPCLLDAVDRDATDWKARLCLGNLYAGLQRHAEAMEQWRAAVAIDDSYAVLHRNLGLGCARWESDPIQATAHYRQAIACNPADYHYYLDLDALWGEHPQAADPAAPAPLSGEALARTRLDLLLSAPPEIQDKWPIVARIAEFKVRLGDYDEALALMQAHHFAPWEGGRHMRSIYTDCLTARAARRAAAGDHAAALADLEASLQYPRNLGVGKVARPDDARLYWLAAEQAAAVGDETRRQELLQGAATEPHHSPCEADAYSILALRALGRTEEAANLNATLKPWAESLLQNDRTKPQGDRVLKLLGA